MFQITGIMYRSDLSTKVNVASASIEGRATPASSPWLIEGNGHERLLVGDRFTLTPNGELLLLSKMRLTHEQAKASRADHP